MSKELKERSFSTFRSTYLGSTVDIDALESANPLCMLVGVTLQHMNAVKTVN
jgi:hypothetical protein